MTKKTIKVETVAEAYLRLMAARGVDYLFANAGTDFAPLIEAFARAERTGDKVPRPIAVPHENAAVSMAHGYAQLTGRPQLVMNHVNVGTANALNGALNASRARIPVILSAGRTPITERGDVPGARNANIHWGQEMYDQAGMLREIVKWDYELRSGANVADVIDRALEMATAAPPGPVYLSLPREVLAEKISEVTFDDPPRRAQGTALPGHDDLDRAADLLAGAEFPIIVTANAGRNPACVGSLADLAERYGIGIVEFRPPYVNLPTDHPMHIGFNPMAMLDKADVVMVMDLDVAWMPVHAKPRDDAKIITLDMDPTYANTPMRSFERDVSLIGDSAAALPLLGEAIAAHAPAKEKIEKRYRRFKAIHDEQRKEWAAGAEKVKDQGPVHPVWLSRCIDEICEPESSIRVHEYPFVPTQMRFTGPGQLLGFSSAGGLGWGFGGALGAKLAAPDKLVVCGLGDGSYMFSNPTPCHYVAAAEDLPILVVLFNNHRWHAVYRSTEAMYKDGAAMQANRMPLVPLEPSPHFEKVAEASGAYGERVEQSDQVMPALERAIKAVTVEKRQALLNVHTQATVM